MRGRRSLSNDASKNDLVRRQRIECGSDGRTVHLSFSYHFIWIGQTRLDR